MLTFLATLVYLSGAATRFSSAADGWLLCLQMGVLFIVPGALAVAVWNAFFVWSSRCGWRRKLGASVVLGSCSVIFWLALMLHLMSLDTHY